MTNEEIRIAIAQAKGIEVAYPFDGKFGPCYQTGLTADKKPYLSKLPNWPENIADAWELYREMKQAGCVVVVTHDPITGHGYCHVNVLNTGARLKSMIGNYAATEELAICLSWLEWKAKWHAQEISHNDP